MTQISHIHALSTPMRLIKLSKNCQKSKFEFVYFVDLKDNVYSGAKKITLIGPENYLLYIVGLLL